VIPVELAPARLWDLPALQKRAADLGVVSGHAPWGTTYVRGVIIDGDRDVLLTGREDSALIIER
jgi:WD40 repeat protein